MQQNQLIHTYTRPPRETFWRIGYVAALLVAAAFGGYLVAAPIYYFLKFQYEWILFFFIVIPLGIWIAYKSLRHLRKLMWEDNHLSSYTLYDNKIRAVEWIEPYSKAPVEREVALDEITSVIASLYIVRQTINTAGLGSRVITETAPVLYIRYTRNGQQQVLNILFPNHGDDNVNVWLGFFKEKKIPLLYTAHPLYRVDTQSHTDEQRLDYFNTAETIVEFPFTGTWLNDEPNVRPAWDSTLDAFIEAEEERNPEFKKARQKHTYKTWIPTMWLTSMVLIGLLYGYLAIGDNIPLSPGNILPGLLIFTFGGFVFFFCLRRYLRWFYMFTYLAIVWISGIWFAVYTVDQAGMQEQLGTSILLAALVYPIAMWIPYFTIKAFMNTNKKSKFVEA